MKNSICSVLLVLVGCGGGNSFTPATTNANKPDSGEPGGNSSIGITDPTVGDSSINQSTGGSLNSIITGGASSVSLSTGGSNTSGTGGSITIGTGGDNSITTGGDQGTGGNPATGGAACTGLTLDILKNTYLCDVSSPIAFNVTKPPLQDINYTFQIQDLNTISRYWCGIQSNPPVQLSYPPPSACDKNDCSSNVYDLVICNAPGLPCGVGSTCPTSACKTDNTCSFTGEICGTGSTCPIVTCKPNDYCST
jgi:hypothetical protein